jgi:hypothetical protein
LDKINSHSSLICLRYSISYFNIFHFPKNIGSDIRTKSVCSKYDLSSMKGFTV